MNALSRHYYKETPHGRASSRANDARRRGIKNEWYTNCPSDLSREQAVYLECERITRETGIEHHVDHIWPLAQGGPHLWFNLQVIPASENLSKHDTYRDSDRIEYIQRIVRLFEDNA
jgi:5-methylcytosine-specific restriction endonuclease McrA